MPELMDIVTVGDMDAKNPRVLRITPCSMVQRHWYHFWVTFEELVEIVRKDYGLESDADAFTQACFVARTLPKNLNT